jgi:hypothetical protein
MEIFGCDATYIPSNVEFRPFLIKGDFHKNYQEVKTNSSGAEISSSEIVIFLRDVEMPPSYKEANQGDHIEIENCRYQIIDIQHHIPGSKKLILHESSASSD